MKHQAERDAFLLNYFRRHNYANVLDAQFIDEYIVGTNAPFIVQPFGANTCRQAGRDLSRLYKSGILDRTAIGLVNAERGFPRWVYVYTLPRVN